MSLDRLLLLLGLILVVLCVLGVLIDLALMSLMRMPLYFSFRFLFEVEPSNGDSVLSTCCVRSCSLVLVVSLMLTLFVCKNVSVS